MIQVKHQFQSFEDYLSYDDGTDKLYELFKELNITVAQIFAAGNQTK